MKRQATRANSRRGRRSAAGDATVQYTVRDVPAHVDRALRRRASEEGKSLNQLLRDALTNQAGGDVASRIAIDTNRYVDFARGDAETVERVQRAQRVYVPFVVLAELRAGFLCGSRAERNEANLTRFLSASRVEVLYADEQTTHQYARLFRQLRTQATPIPTNDLWTGALAVQHGLHLFARDRHFDHLPQIPRV